MNEGDDTECDLFHVRGFGWVGRNGWSINTIFFGFIGGGDFLFTFDEFGDPVLTQLLFWYQNSRDRWKFWSIERSSLNLISFPTPVQFVVQT